MKRRTQTERREATIRKLLDATTLALVEVGYAGASVMEISRRAGVSHGGLFRHFASLEELMVAAAEDVGHKLLSRYREKFEKLAGAEQPLPLALRLLRETCRSRLNQAWYELAVAARTRPRLRRAIAPIGARYYAEIVVLARRLLPDLAEALGARFELLVEMMVQIFDGEQMQRLLAREAPGDDQRLELLLTVLEAALPALAAPPRRRVDLKMHLGRP